MTSGFCLVTPASRGLGFAFARHLLAHSDLPVVATARRDCDQVQDQLLQGVKNKDKERLRVFQVDVTGISPYNIYVKASRTQLIQYRRIHHLLHGIYPSRHLPQHIPASRINSTRRTARRKSTLPSRRNKRPPQLPSKYPRPLTLTQASSPIPTNQIIPPHSNQPAPKPGTEERQS